MLGSYDLVVLGGGVIGCAVAERMRETWSHICLVEKGRSIGRGASSAAIGGINPQLDDQLLGPLGSMAQHSRELFPGWVASIAEEAETPVPLLATGLMRAAMTPEEMERLAGVVFPVLRERAVPALVLDGVMAREREPLLGPNTIGGLISIDDLAIEPPLLMRALERVLAADPRVELLTSVTATGITSTSGGVVVTLADGRWLAAERVVVATGHDSHALLALAPDALFPVKGQALEFSGSPANGRSLSMACDALVDTDEGPQVAFALPRPDGRIAAGVTFEAQVGDTEPTEWGRQSILRTLAAVFPRMVAMPVRRHWAGVRPGSADGAPVIGPVDEHGRVIAATGHYGAGITLAPATAELVAVLLTGGSRNAHSSALELCSPARYEEVLTNRVQ